MINLFIFILAFIYSYFRRTTNATDTPFPTLPVQNEEKPQSPAAFQPEEAEINTFRDKTKRPPPKKMQTPPKVELKQNEETVYDLNSLAVAAGENHVDKNSILMHQIFSGVRSPIKDDFDDTKMVDAQKEDKVVRNKKIKNETLKKHNKSLEVENKKKIVDHDTRKAPELMVQVENNVQMQNCEVKMEEETEKRVAIKIKLCSVCNTHHLQDNCSLQNPHCLLLDSLTLSEWQKRYKPLLDEKSNSDSDSTDSNIKLSFAVMSLPSILCLKENNNTWGVFAKAAIKTHAQFGPLIGKTVREVDIPEDSNMKDYWEVQTEKYHGFVCTENVEESNWMRFVRPASTREERNVTVMCRNDELYFVTIKDLQGGDELLYWQDGNVVANKKKMEKTSKLFEIVR